MSRKRYSAEQIIRKLREAEVELARGLSTGAVCKKLGVTTNSRPGGLATRESQRHSQRIPYRQRAVLTR